MAHYVAVTEFFPLGSRGLVQDHVHARYKIQSTSTAVIELARSTIVLASFSHWSARSKKSVHSKDHAFL
jgi:hypothetical protein